MKICLFDPGIKNNEGQYSANLGDLIIQEAVKREIFRIFRNSELSHISTHVYPTKEEIEIARKSDLILVGGSNLLGSRMREYAQWKVSLKQKIKLSKCVLLGVGWRNYESNPDLYTTISLQAGLSNKYLHSVRDSYAKAKLNSAGINNVINTGCVTMWPFTSFDQGVIPTKKAENALIMLTDYAKNTSADKQLVELVLNHYERVFVWSQGERDMTYAVSLVSDKDFPIVILNQKKFQRISQLSDLPDSPFIILDHSIEIFRSFLESSIEFDYIGTRLHGGIKCLLSKRRSLIIEVDNRAKEIASETGLPTASREDFDFMKRWIRKEYSTNIKVKPEPIEHWRSQFNRFKKHSASR